MILVVKKLSLLIFVILLIACSEKSRLYHFRGETMGTAYSVKYFANEDNSNEIKKEVDQRLIVFNQALSTYIPESEISRFNSNLSNDWISISDDFVENLRVALDIYKKTDRLYDVSISKLIDRWRFGSKRIKDIDWTLPSEAELSSIKKCIGLDRFDINLDQKKIRKKRGCLELNFSSLAKGQGVDLVSDYLLSLGLNNSMVEIGGEVRVRGDKGNKPWRIGVESADLSKGLQSVVTLNDSECIASSGSYRNFFDYNGKRYSHTINPKSGYPVRHNIVAVTVIASNCILADAWATAFNVIGLEKSLTLAKKEKLWAQFMINKNSKLETVKTGTRN